MLLLTNCRQKGDAEVRRNLPGSWIAAGPDSAGGHFSNMITVARDGDYVAHVVSQYSSDGVERTYETAGKFEVRDGMLIDTMTKHSNTNAVLPYTFRSRIVRFDGRELVLKAEPNDQVSFPTNDVVLRKVGR
jgi:hypothetical protein